MVCLQFQDHSLPHLTLCRSPYQTLRSATLFPEYRWYREPRPWLRTVPSHHRVVEDRHYSHHQHRCARTLLSRRCFCSVTGCYCYCIACKKSSAVARETAWSTQLRTRATQTAARPHTACARARKGVGKRAG